MFGANNEGLPRLNQITTTILARIARGSDDRGATLVEYGLLLLFVFIAALLSVKLMGDSVVALFDSTANTLDTAPGVEQPVEG